MKHVNLKFHLASFLDIITKISQTILTKTRPKFMQYVLAQCGSKSKECERLHTSSEQKKEALSVLSLNFTKELLQGPINVTYFPCRYDAKRVRCFLSQFSIYWFSLTIIFFPFWLFSSHLCSLVRSQGHILCH